MRLSVLIVNFNSAPFLKRCLISVQTHLAEIPHEVCVVDNGSSDGSCEFIRKRFSTVKLVANPKNRGFTAALNQGLKETSGTYALWLNPDAELLDGGFRILLDYMDAHPAVGILGPQVVNPDGSRQLSCRTFPSYRTALFHRYAFLTRLFPMNPLSRQYLCSDWDPNAIHSADWISGACFLHRRAVADELGGLDDRFFMYCEDVDFCLRAKQSGWSVCYHPAARVLHHIDVSGRQVPYRSMVERHRSMWRYYAKHFQRNPAKDLLVGFGIWLRCGFLLASRAFGR